MLFGIGGHPGFICNYTNEKCNIIGVEIHQKQTLNCVVFDMLENEILNNNIITL